MFTGIIEEIGSICAVASGAASCRLTVSAGIILEDIKLGDSVAVNGVCLTADALTGSSFTADVMPETMRKTALGSLRRGSRVNLERAMPANGRFGGHIVSGHIDGVGMVKSQTRDDNAVWLNILAAPPLLALLVEKGSVAVDGVSLTVARLEHEGFWVSLIPHTAGRTILLQKQARDAVNLECDIIGKYLQKLLGANFTKPVPGGIDLDLLKENGFY